MADHFPDEIPILRETLESHPEDWETRLALIEHSIREGDRRGAQELIRTSPDDCPPPEGYPARIHALLTKGVSPPSSEPTENPSIETIKPRLEKQEPVPSPSTDNLQPKPRFAGLDWADESIEKSKPRIIYPDLEPEPAPLNFDSDQFRPPPLELEAFELGPGNTNSFTSVGNRIGAVAGAIIIHLVLILLFLMVKIAIPPPNPPMLTVSSISSSKEPSLESVSLANRSEKKSAPDPSAVPLVSSLDFSSFAVPITPKFGMDFSTAIMPNSEDGLGLTLSGNGNVSNLGAIPKAMRSRCSLAERLRRLDQSGGDFRAEKAVVRGLDFLTSQQNSETGAVGSNYKVGMTGLTLLAYLGHCETQESPKYGPSVVRAAFYLVDRGLKNKGLMTNGSRGNHEAYEHAIATYALAELYTMTKEIGKPIPRVGIVLKKATQVIVDSQDGLGGWSYLKGGTEDMSVSGWNIQALKAVYNTGEFPEVAEVLDKAIKNYLPAVCDRNGAFKYRPDNESGKATLTGAGVLGLQIWGRMRYPIYEKTFDYLRTTYANPTPGKNYYAPYYNTQVFFLHGGEEWKAYNKKFMPQLLDAQNPDGSWLRPRLGHGGADSQILNTALAVLMLEVYYRYLPTTDKVKDLQRR